jgi:hypothetical protein
MQIEIPQILIRKFIDIETETRVGFYGEIEAEVRTKSGLVKQHMKFKNVITDWGLKYLAEKGGQIVDVFYYLILGTGTTTPVSTDVTLQSGDASTVSSSISNRTISSGGSGNDRWIKYTFEYLPNNIIGTWSELGLLASASSPYNVLTRALFPVPLQVGEDDIPTINYTIHAVRTTDTPTEVTVNLAGVGNITCQSILLDQGLFNIMRADLTSSSYNAMRLFVSQPNLVHCRIGSNNDELTPSMTNIRSLIGNASVWSASTYAANSMYRDISMNYPQSLVGTIHEEVYTPGGGKYETPAVAIRYVEGIPKDNTKTFRTKHRFAFSRA